MGRFVICMTHALACSDVTEHHARMIVGSDPAPNKQPYNRHLCCVPSLILIPFTQVFKTFISKGIPWDNGDLWYVISSDIDKLL